VDKSIISSTVGLHPANIGKVNYTNQGFTLGKWRGVKKDENDALIRLADAVCGFVRAAREGQATMQSLLEQAIRKEIIRDLSKK
jgi:hypothetical protein